MNGSLLISDDETPASPPLTSKILQVSSGRRHNYAAKNDNSGSRNSSGRRLSPRFPELNEANVKEVPVKQFEAIAVEPKAPVVAAKFEKPLEGEFSINIGSNYIIHSDKRDRVDAIMVNSSRRKDKDDVIVIGGIDATSPVASPRAKDPRMSPPASRRNNRRNDEPLIEIIEEPKSNPMSSRRRINKSSGASTTKPTSRPSNNVEVVNVKSSGKSSDSVDKIKVRKDTKKEKKSTNRTVPKSSINVRIGGKQLTSRELAELNDSSSQTSSQQSSVPSSSRDSGPNRDSDSNTSEISSRRMIKTRTDAIEKELKKQYPKEHKENRFKAETDEDLAKAMKVALEVSKEQSVREAIDAGYHLNAEVLKHLERPNSVTEVIEHLVSQRRERLRSSQRRPDKKSQAKPANKNRTATPRPKTPEPQSAVLEEEEEEVTDEQEEEEDEEVGDDPNNGFNIPIDGNTTFSFPTSIPEQPNDEEEANVRLPKAERKIRKGDVLEPSDDIGQRQFVYDPLGIGNDFDGDDVQKIDEIYEESSEDEAKLTVDEKKDEMLYRFRLIRETYPNLAMPKITKRMKLAKMVRHYENIASRVKLKTKTNNFKIFVILGFFLMQWVIKKVTGIDTAGLAQNQMYSMKQYEPYLRELGESDWASIGSNMSVYIRLPFFMFVNTAIFICAKAVFKRTGEDYTEQFRKLYNQLTGGDDYLYIKDPNGSAGLDAGNGGGEEEGGGGLLGMLKPFMSMFGGFGGGGGNATPAPKRGEATGATYVRRKRPT